LHDGFLSKHSLTFQAREIYEQAVEFFGDEYMDEKLFIAFAQFEETQKVCLETKCPD